MCLGAMEVVELCVADDSPLWRLVHAAHRRIDLRVCGGLSGEELAAEIVGRLGLGGEAGAVLLLYRGYGPTGYVVLNGAGGVLAAGVVREGECG